MLDSGLIEGITSKYIALAPLMDERMRRQWAAAEANAIVYFVKRFSPKKSYKNTHQAVGTFTWPLCFMSAFFIL